MPAALALQRMIGNRAVGKLVARTPEKSVDLLEPAIMGAHVDVTQINRALLPYSKDQESFDKVAEGYETKTKVTLEKAPLKSTRTMYVDQTGDLRHHLLF